MKLHLSMKPNLFGLNKRLAMNWIFNLPVNLLLANCVLSRVKYMKIIW